MTDSQLSARPPRKRFDVLATPEAQAFVGQAPDAIALSQETVGQGGAVPAPTVIEAPLPTPVVEETTWKAYPLRVRPSVHDKLTFIAKHSPRSVNEFINDALAPAIERELERLKKISELGLDKFT